MTTTRRPASSSACTSRAHHSGDGARAGTDAPGWTTTYGCSPVSARVSGRSARTLQAAQVAVGQREAGCLGQAELALGLVQAVLGQPVAQVEQRAGVVLAHGADPADAGEAQDERGRQRALVERRQHQRPVDAGGPDPLDDRRDVGRVDRRGVGDDPRAGPDEHLVDARQQPGGGCALRADEQDHAVAGRGDGAHGRTGEQHVAVAVEAHHHRACVTHGVAEQQGDRGGQVGGDGHAGRAGGVDLLARG